MTNNRRAITLWVLVLALVALAGFAASTATSAKAFTFKAIINTIADNPTPTCTVAGYVFNPKTGTCDKVTVTNVTVVLAGKSVSASDVASGKITILADDTVKGGIKSVQIHSPRCHWTKPGEVWWNSFIDGNGHRVWYQETVPGYLCPSKASPTGWAKAAGGKTGRHCYNPAKESKKAPGPVVKGIVVSFSSFAKVTIPLKAAVAVEVHDTCGSAQASALATANISLGAFVRTKGNVSTDVFGSAIALLSTSAKANISCTPPPTVTTPGTTTTVPGTTTTTPGTTTTVPGTTTTTLTPPCTPAADRNQYNNCVSPCPPGESRYTRSAQAGSYGFVDAGNGGYYSVFYNDTGNGFWGQSNQIPSGAASGNAACYKPAPPPGGGTGGPPPSP